MSKRILVCGAGGFIGGHLVKRLKSEGFWVRGVDIKTHEFSDVQSDESMLLDLRNVDSCHTATESIDEIYQLAADMGGAGFVFTGGNDGDIMHNSAMINLNIAHSAVENKVKKIFYSSSACVYPKRNQEDPNNPICSESSAYPAEPDSEYGWEKLFSERLYLTFQRLHDIDVRIARFHNIFGPYGTWCGGREKAPAALCRKVAKAKDGDTIGVWGSGDQTRSFLYIDECIEGVRRLMDSSVTDVLNIGSQEMISINNLAKMVINISGKNIDIKNISGPIGVNGRNSDNLLISKQLGWSPDYPLIDGIKKTYEWISSRVDKTW